MPKRSQSNTQQKQPANISNQEVEVPMTAEQRDTLIGEQEEIIKKQDKTIDKLNTEIEEMKSALDNGPLLSPNTGLLSEVTTRTQSLSFEERVWDKVLESAILGILNRQVPIMTDTAVDHLMKDALRMADRAKNIAREYIKKQEQMAKEEKSKVDPLQDLMKDAG